MWLWKNVKFGNNVATKRPVTSFDNTVAEERPKE
jgi:hypothetical protein